MAIVRWFLVGILLISISSCSFAGTSSKDVRYFRVFAIKNFNENNYIKKFHFQLREPKGDKYYKVICKNKLPSKAFLIKRGVLDTEYIFDEKGRVISQSSTNRKSRCDSDLKNKITIRKCYKENKLISVDINKYNNQDIQVENYYSEEDGGVKNKIIYDHDNDLTYRTNLITDSTIKEKTSFSRYSKENRFHRYNVNRSYNDDTVYMNSSKSSGCR